MCNSIGFGKVTYSCAYLKKDWDQAFYLQQNLVLLNLWKLLSRWISNVFSGDSLEMNAWIWVEMGILHLILHFIAVIRGVWISA